MEGLIYYILFLPWEKRASKYSPHFRFALKSNLGAVTSNKLEFATKWFLKISFGQKMRSQIPPDEALRKDKY